MFSTRKILNDFYRAVLSSALLIGPGVADEWNAGSASTYWRGPNSTYFDGTTFLFFRQDAMGIPKQMLSTRDLIFDTVNDL